MHRLEKILRTARPSAAVQFRPLGYTAADAREFLRDVLALANAECEGSRLIVLGAKPTQSGSRSFVDAHPPGHEPLAYVALAGEYIEPALRLAYHKVSIDGADAGVVQIGGCHELPYMLRVDHCAALRRGDAYQRVGTSAVKMGRSQFEKIYAARFRGSKPARHVEIGFAGDYIVKDWCIPTVDLTQRPSAIAGAKLRELIDAQENASGSGSTTVVARLTHARLYGSDQPYESRSRAELLKDLASVGDRLWNDDQRFLYARHGQDLDLVMLNQGEDAVTDLQVTLTLPRVDGLHVANPTVTPLVAGSGYPTVESNDKHIRISGTLAALEPGEPLSVFTRPARFCAGLGLAGKSISVDYSLTASNLGAPVSGTLQLSFQAPAQRSLIA